MGYVMRAQVKEVAKAKMLDTMPKYNGSEEIRIVWDNLQRDVKRAIIYNYRIYTRDRVISSKWRTMCEWFCFFPPFPTAALLEVSRASRRVFPSRGSDPVVARISRTTGDRDNFNAGL